MGVELNDMGFLYNFPNLRYLGLEGIKYNNRIMDLNNTLIEYFIVSHIQTNETIELLNYNNLKEFICFYSNININIAGIKIIDNYDDFINEPEYFELFEW
ncbi:MAG: hypothetical protein LBH20_05260 [Treponema sp.]|jgi:hypothetical protein|nr:hypothetical protein [Treponema sp.]